MGAAEREELTALRPRILRYLTRLVGAREAEDLAQSVLLKATEGFGGFRRDSSLSTWVYRIATNAALDKLRVRSKEPAPAEADTAVMVEPQVPSVEAAAIRAEMSSCIREFVDRLPADYKAVIALSELEGFTNAEIAAVLDVSLDTVKIRLHRAREKLRGQMREGCSFYRDEGDGLACERKQ